MHSTMSVTAPWHRSTPVRSDRRSIRASREMGHDSTVMNRSQGLVIGFFVAAVISLTAILVFAPETYAGALGASGASRAGTEIVFLALLVVFIALLAAGVLRRWRWTFWLIVVAFLFGVLRVPASILQLTGALPAAGPPWYVLFQALVGLLQCAIGLAMLAGYRRAGVWGAF